MKKLLMMIGTVYLGGVVWSFYGLYQGQKKSGHTPELLKVLQSEDAWLWPLALLFRLK